MMGNNIFEQYGQETPDSDAPIEVSRRQAHPKEKFSLYKIMQAIFSPLRQDVQTQVPARKRFRASSEWPKTSRYGEKRRAKRLRKRNRLRAIKYGKRAGAATLVMGLTAVVIFWAKFAVVYDIPPFLQTGSLQNVQAYVVFKSWWFGPPSFDLGAFHNLDPDNPEFYLIQQLERYQDIITNPNEIIFVIVKNTNN